MTLYTVQDVCKKVQISESMFYKLRKSGRGPDVIKIGRSNRISEDDLKKWISSMESDGKSQVLQ